MNTNEVLANRAAERLGGTRGEYTLVHPNDHVNMGQSTNDVYPTATRLALLLAHRGLTEAARALAASLDGKARTFERILKVGRTHLQDAVPMTLGQEFSGFAACIARGAEDVERASEQLTELNLGATAVGTGLNAGEDYTRLAVEHLSRLTGLPLRPATNCFRVTQSMGDVVGYSGAMRRLAVELTNGSSIMPGKVNPSIPEMVNQVCYQVFGCDVTICTAAEGGQLELNVMMPVMAWNAIHASTILRHSMESLRTRCVDGIQPDEGRCRELMDRSTAVATALSPYVGYAVTAEVAKESVRTGKPIRRHDPASRGAR
jgi:aspartate ammonia-lyase